ncbi:MAG TPA: hypothetical protein VGH20_16565 [Myxococcales bacterium]|jgi:hypothetical protein
MLRAAPFVLFVAFISGCTGSYFADEEKEDEELVPNRSATTGTCGVERWAVKTGTDAAASQVNLTPKSTTIASLRAIAAPSTLGTTSTRFTTAGSPEIQVFRLTNVTLTEYKIETDSDYHLVLSDGTNTMIAEIPDPACVPSGPWVSSVKTARAAFDAKFPSVTSSFKVANVVATVTGAGFFDLLHGQTGVAPNGIELHAVLGICFGANCAPPPPPPPTGNPFVNAGFETGTLSGWTATGIAAARTFPHTGTFSGSLGSSSPSTDSTLIQTVTMPAGATTLSFWYRVFCNDTITFDWVTATLRDNTTGTTVTALPKTCTNNNTYVQVSVNVTAMRGHSVTLTLVNHDDNHVGDATFTDFDDVNVQ